MKYRTEIDGLRALAVLPVILFHAGFELFSGGFVGVDVFFVISGYLITTILMEDLENNQFSIVKFYERRVRRILPALFFVMLTCIPFAWAWMPPSQLQDFSQSLVAVSLFVSNMLFWQESGYFDAAAEEKPLLHTWSLAVEEQYYLLFPIFLFLVWRFGKNRVFWMIVIMAAISFTLSEWGWRNRPSANFFLAPTRAWELLAGSIAAFVVQKRGVRANNILSLVGLAAIVYAILAYDKSTPFPSIYALVPVLGVVLLILYARKETFVAKLLSIKLIVGIGLISYSAYLWHQPLFAFARIRLLDEPSLLLMAVLSLTSLIFGALSWQYIEKPFRVKTSLFSSGKVIFHLSSVGILAFVTIGFIGYENEGFKVRFDIADSVYDSISRTNRRSECFGKKSIHKRVDWNCKIGEASTKPSLFVFGDSHALSFLPVIEAAARKLQLSGYFAGTSGCTPLLSIYALREDQVNKNCHALNKRVFEFVEMNNIKKVILVARWTYYTDGGYQGDDFSYISLKESDDRTQIISRDTFEVGLLNTVDAYKEIGVELIIVPQIPQQKSNPLKLYVASEKGKTSIENVSVSLKEHNKLQSYVNTLFNKSGVKLVDFTENFCFHGRCVVGNEKVSFYYDEDHLSLSGSAKIVDATIEFLQANE